MFPPRAPPDSSFSPVRGLPRNTPWGVLVLALLAGPGLASELRFEEGIAHAPKGRTEMYREQHWIRSEQGRPLERLVLYRCPDGTAFARKRVDYRGSATAPAFALEDHRSGYREGLRRRGGASLYVKDGRNAVEQVAPIAGADLVADAGFDEFIRQQWRGLVAGRSLPLSFAVPSRLRSLPFSVQRSGESVIGGEAAWIFELRLDGWLGVFAPKIEVAYGKESRRLLRFLGLSNLRDDQGEDSLVTRIEFASPSRAGTEVGWAAAASQPLSACRTGR